MSSPAIANPTDRWIHSPTLDLMLGCGGAFGVVFLFILAMPEQLQALFPLGLLPLLVLVTSIPHYGATLQRVYGDRESRQKYRLLAVWVTIAIYAWLGIGVYNVVLGSWLITLYLTWSPWHYTGQNYGLAMMFLGRRGGAVEPSTKRILYISFVLSYAIAFLGVHGVGGPSSYTVPTTYQLIRLGIPAAVYDVLLPSLVAVYALASGFALFKLNRTRSLADLVPAMGLMLLQSTWFCIPVLAHAGALPGWMPDRHVEIYTLMWIGIAHAVQYLWITSYYTKTANPDLPTPTYYRSALLAGGTIWGVPAFLFAPDALGGPAFDSGLAILVAAAVNVHHFVLDGAIWKLRDGRIARILLRTGHERVREKAESIRRSLRRRVVTAVTTAAGFAYVGVVTVGTLETEYGIRRVSSPPDYSRMQTAAKRLRRIGRDNSGLRYDLGMAAMARGEFGVARSELERSLELEDAPATWIGLGNVAEREARWADAIEAYEAALVGNPNSLPALSQSARLLQKTGQIERAIERVERARVLVPGHEGLVTWLERLRDERRR